MRGRAAAVAEPQTGGLSLQVRKRAIYPPWMPLIPMTGVTRAATTCTSTGRTSTWTSRTSELRRLAWLIAAGASALAALVLAGVALMLWAALPTPDAAHLWLLWVVPLVPAVLAVVAIVAARPSTHQPAFAELRGQLRQDLELVREGLAS